MFEIEIQYLISLREKKNMLLKFLKNKIKGKNLNQKNYAEFTKSMKLNPLIFFCVASPHFARS